jgi:hypothetical protein
MLINDGQQQIGLFVGLIQQNTSNELRNVVYHRFQSVDVGDQGQDDNGSKLDGMFRGIQVGVEKERNWVKWGWTGEIGLSALETKAYGHWANHDPAWNWVDDGFTLGWRADFGMRYAITRNISAELGYSANYARNYFGLSVCDENIGGEGLDENGEFMADRVVLSYWQQGIRIGLKFIF